MGVDTGKSAKRMGRMSPKEARSIDQDPMRLPPHKKPKVYRLTVRISRSNTAVYQKDFTNKAAMQAFRAGVEREIRKEKATPPRRTWNTWGNWWSSDLRMEGVDYKSVEGEPELTEEFIDG